MRIQYVSSVSSGRGKKRRIQPKPRWLIVGAVFCALLAGLIMLLAPAAVVLFGVLSGVFAVWGVVLWIWQLFD